MTTNTNNTVWTKQSGYITPSSQSLFNNVLNDTLMISKDDFKIELSKAKSFIINIWGCFCLLLIFGGIWIDGYRWKLLSSGVLLIVVLVLYYLAETEKMKKLKYLASRI